MALLKADEKSPFLPKPGDETARPAAGERDTGEAGGRAAGGGRGAAGAAAGGDAGAQGRAAASRTQPPPRVEIDFDGIQDRIIALNLPARDYSNLQAGVEGQIFYVDGGTLRRYSLSDQEARDFVTGASTYTLSTDRRKMLYRSGGGGRGGRGGGGGSAGWSIVDSDRNPPTGSNGALNTAGVRMRIDPRAEFKQMFAEGWRFQRDYLYVPNMHGVDYAKTKAMYEPLLDYVAHRSDLNYLLDWMGGEVAIGHSFVRGGDTPDTENVPVGLMGADLEIAGGRYRIAKVYTGESWNGSLRGPLAQPGMDVGAGDFILAVNGVELRAPENPYRLFEQTSGRQTVLRVADSADGANARDVIVVPTANEGGLRREEWIESNRRKVDELSGGRLAYVWLPNTGRGGYGNFNRYYFAQQDKQGAIIDERFNSGGSAADYIVEFMARQPHGYFNNPVGERTPFTSPAAGSWGPKVMIINEMAGSGGDLMPYMFRYYEVGPLVGTRTWGGLVGTWDTPPLLDGGSMIAPRGGFFDIDGEWAVENEGTPPDIQVEMTPKDVIAGRDPQLERAVGEAMKLLETGRFQRKTEPPPPIRSRRPGGG